MSENFIKHFIALIGTLICLLAYFAGYASGVRGWWITVLAVAIIYIAIVKLIDPAHH